MSDAVQPLTSSSATSIGDERISRPNVRTKIVATVGPASASVERLTQLILHGAAVFRLNMAHGTLSEHQQAWDNIRQASQQAGLPVGVLVDLAGPKIRLGSLVEDPLHLEAQQRIFIVRGEASSQPNELTVTYEPLIEEADVGDWIMLADGLLRLRVEGKQAGRLELRVVEGGTVRSRQGVNLPGVKLRAAAMGPEDIECAMWAAAQQVDYVSLSFVRTADEVRQLRELLTQHGSQAMVVAKIEKREALEQLEAIVQAADAVMVARGDLGVEIAIEKTPLAQKRIINVCCKYRRPVIVATQMLESMHTSRIPTRAEASDVANAILDGADACMLSGETAIGQYPIEAVAMMHRIARETESMLRGRPSTVPDPEDFEPSNISEAVVFGAAEIARRIDARLVAIATSDGEAARIKSKQRHFIATVAVTDQPAIQRRMCLFWGIYPLLHAHTDREDVLHDVVSRWAHRHLPVSGGERMVLVMDSQVQPGMHDLVLVASLAPPPKD